MVNTTSEFGLRVPVEQYLYKLPLFHNKKPSFGCGDITLCGAKVSHEEPHCKRLKLQLDEGF